MANEKISQLVNQAVIDPANLIPIIDLSAGPAGSKQVTVSQLDLRYVNANFTKITLIGSQIQTASSLPPLLIPGPPGGFFYQWIGATMFYHYGTQPYTSNVITLNSRANNTTIFQTPGTFLSGVDDVFGQYILQQQTYIDASQGLEATADSDSVGFGDGTLDIYLQYSILPL